MSASEITPPVAATSAGTTTPEPKRLQAWPGWLGGLLLVLLVVAVYLPSAVQNRYIWDDDKYLTDTDHHLIFPEKGSDETRWDCLKRIWTTNAAPQYYPLVFTTYWLEYGLWELAPQGYHIDNLLLHAITCVLVWRILRRLRVPGAWLAAAIFALHPVNVETVAWVTERKNTLSGVFYMVAMLAYLRFGERDKWWWYFISLAAFVLALLSKTVTSTLPVAMILVFWLRGRNVAWPRLVGLIPFLAAGLFMGRLTAWYEFHKNNADYWEPMPITKAVRLAWTEDRIVVRERSGYELQPDQRLLIASRSLLHYARTLVAPYPLAFFYDRWGEHKELDTSQTRNWAPVAAVAAIAVLSVVLGVTVHRGILIGVAFFVLTVFPALGFFDVWPMRYSFVADHFQYLASLGLITLFAAGATLLVRRLGGEPIPAMNGASFGGGTLAILLIVALGALTFARAKVFKDKETLYTDTIRKTPTAWISYVNLGVMYAQRQDWARAATTFAGAVDQFDDFANEAAEFTPERAGVLLAAASNLGNAAAMAGRFGEAEDAFEKAIGLTERLHDKRPKLSPIDATLYVRLAKAMLAQKTEAKRAEALGVFERAASRLPDSALIYREWAEMLEKSGRSQEAAEKYARATALSRGEAVPPDGTRTPDAAAPTGIDLGAATTPAARRKAYKDLMDVAVAQRDYRKAMDVYMESRKEFPSDSGLIRRCALLLAAAPIDGLRDGKNAVLAGELLYAPLKQLNRLDGEDMEAIAAAYAEVGRFDDAVKAAEEGIQLASRPQDGIIKRRLTAQLALYRQKKPYRLPPAEAGRSPARGAPATQPSGPANTVQQDAAR